MAFDKAVDSSLLDTGLTEIADAVRNKGKLTGQFDFPAPNDIASTILQKLIADNGTIFEKVEIIRNKRDGKNSIRIGDTTNLAFIYVVRERDTTNLKIDGLIELALPVDPIFTGGFNFGEEIQGFYGTGIASKYDSQGALSYKAGFGLIRDVDGEKQLVLDSKPLAVFDFAKDEFYTIYKGYGPLRV